MSGGITLPSTAAIGNDWLSQSQQISEGMAASRMIWSENTSARDHGVVGIAFHSFHFQ